MVSPLQVSADDIKRLNDVQLTHILKLLLHQEAHRFGIRQREITVGTNINVGDGGEDGRIKWDSAEPVQTDYLPHRFTQFQNKAMDMGPANCRAAVLKADSSAVLPLVHDALTQGATYILFTTQEQNQRQQTDNIAAIRQAFNDLGQGYAATANLLIYDAGKIASWVNNYLAAVVTILDWVGRSAEGLKTWVDWGQYPEYLEYPYIPDDARRGAIEQLRIKLMIPRASARIVGLSGLGKSRLAYEVFNGPMFGDGMGKQVVYYDAAGVSDFHVRVTSWIAAGLEGILVVDNCELELHNRLSQEVTRLDSKLSLLTLDFNLGRPGSGTVLVELGQMPDACIVEMLRPTFGDQIRDLPRVVQFAQGFPQIAVLLAKARVELQPDIGNLNDDLLAKKLLWGSDAPNVMEEKILEGCALFDRFGIAEDVQTEYKFIADHIVNVSHSAFYACVQKFRGRKLIDRRGRYSQLVPKPLAVRMAARWWSTALPEIQQKLIDGTMPESLVDGFCTQISMLHFVPEAKALTETLCGHTSPFGQAEVILSDRGSRLFRAFADVNPAAVSSALARVLHPMNLEQLRVIGGDPRRSLVRTLERLCFHAAHFIESCWTMLLLAGAENETWSNNATGYFKQFFRCFNSGTEAAPQVRFQVLDRALADSRQEIRMLAHKAISEMLGNPRGFRTVGAEYRGGDEPLQEWKPTIWQEVFDYWDGGMTRLVTFVVSGNQIEKQEAKSAIANSIRHMMTYGRLEMLDRAIQTVVQHEGHLWPDAVDAIRLTIQYDSGPMPQEAKDKLSGWIELLQPVSIAEKLNLYVTNSSFEYVEMEDGEHVDKAVERATDLANELSTDIPSLLPHIAALFEGEQQQAIVFGRHLAQCSAQYGLLLERSLQILKEKARPNVQFIAGIFSGIYVVDESAWHDAIRLVGDDELLDRFYNYFLSTGRPDINELYQSIDLVRRQRQSASFVEPLAYGKTLSHLSSVELSAFTLKFSEISSLAAWYALEILFMNVHGDQDKLKVVRDTLKSILLRISLVSEEMNTQLIWHSWSTTVLYVMRDETDPTFSAQLAEQIYTSAVVGMDYSARTHYVQPVLRELFRKFPADTWKVFASGLPAIDSIKLYEMIQLLGSERVLKKNLEPVIAELPDELVESWCVANVEFAPVFLATLTDTLFESGGKISISPRATFLLDHFGNNPKVLGQLGANLSSFSWEGSMVPYLERELAAMRTIENHPLESVRQWVANRIRYLQSEIEHNKARDAEQDWGIY